jgi:hypothetical protein
MKKISREQAEKLFMDSEVVTSSIQQDKDELRVIMKLSTNQSCHVTYHFKSNTKTYFVEESGSEVSDSSPSPTKLDSV